MAWTRKPPTEPGWYGWRELENAEGDAYDPDPVLMHVFIANGELLVGLHRPIHDYDDGEWWDEAIVLPWE